MNTAQSEGLNIGYYLSLVSRRRWFIIVPFCLAMIVGMVLAVKLPKIYEASTLILVQPQRVPEKIVTPVVDGYVESRISTLSQQIMSRSNLERVIAKFKLFSDPGSAEMLAEDKVESLRKRIKVQIGDPKARRTMADSFSIVFQDPDPQIAMKVTNGLAKLFHRRKPKGARRHRCRHHRFPGHRTGHHAQTPGGSGGDPEKVP